MLSVAGNSDSRGKLTTMRGIPFLQHSAAFQTKYCVASSLAAEQDECCAVELCLPLHELQRLTKVSEIQKDI
jgi:hypothetical protein